MRKRKTIQQTLVMKALEELTGHPTAMEIYSKVKEEYDGISIATIYSNLKSLVQAGQLLVITVAGHADRYDKTLAEHHHIRCQNCGDLCDLSATKMAGMNEHIAKTSGYTVQGYEILFHGICPRCRNKDKAHKISMKLSER